MKRMKIQLQKLACFSALACCALPAQAADRPEFEVASIKPAPPPSGNMIRIGMAGGPGTPDPGRVNFEYVNLRQVLTRAYGVKSYQITGPSTLDSERFIITAKVPPGTTKEVFQVMLQNLIADRFKLTLHRENKELPAFSLVAAKGGPKMKVTPEPDPNAVPPEPGQAAAPIAPGRMQMGKDGFPVMPAGGRGMRMMMMNGRAKLSGDGMTMAQLCESLTQQLDKA